MLRASSSKSNHTGSSGPPGNVVGRAFESSRETPMGATAMNVQGKRTAVSEGLIRQTAPDGEIPRDEEIDASWKDSGDDDTEAFIVFAISEGSDEHSGALEALACHRRLRERLWWAEHQILGWLKVLEDSDDGPEGKPTVEPDEPGA